MGELVARAAQAAPLVIVLEDLHWADAMSVRFLAFLARRLGALPGLVVGSVRPEDAVDPVLEQALGELRATGRLDEIPLGGLGQDESLALARGLYRGGRDPGVIGELADDLWALSEGNPFIIVETVRALVQDVTAGGERRPRLARTVRDSVAGRLARLSAGARQAVAAAAVIGRACSFALLHRTTGLGELETAAAVEELVRRRVLDGVGEQLSFCHDRIRQVAYDELLPARRVALHGTVAEALETLHAGDLDEVSDELGRHFLRAGAAEKALSYLTRFADVAARRYAMDGALRALQQAAEVLERLPEPRRDHQRLDVALRQAFILALAGRHRDCLDLLREHEMLERRVADPVLAAEYHFRLAMTCHYLGEPDDARRAAEAAVAAGEKAHDDQRLGKALYALALISVLAGSASAAVRHASRAIQLLDDPRMSHWLGLAHFILGYSLWVTGQYDGALEHAGRCAAVGRAVGDRRLQSMGGTVSGWVHAARGETALARDAAREAAEIARDPISTGLALSTLGAAELAAGQAHGAVEAFGRALSMPASAFTQVRVQALLADAQLADGDGAGARETARQALLRAQAIGAPFCVGLAERATGRIAREAGEPARAVEHLTRGLEAFLSGDAVPEAAVTRVELARALAELGDLAQARAHLAQAAAEFETAGAARRAAEARDLARALGPAPVGAGG
jgi:predicted ATPase